MNRLAIKLYLSNFKIITLCLGVVVGLSSCSNRPHPAILEDITYANKVTRGLHVVDYGESLYSIAFRYGRDFRELAAINGLDKPYKLHLGQKIYLNKKDYKGIGNNKNNKILIKTSKSATTKALNKSVHIEKTYINQYASGGDWIWPVSGHVNVHFDSKDKINKGIDITVKTATKVKASAAGTVVYMGTGLKGYGQIIIIKHSEEFLSAYAHNDLLLVKEGQAVKQGQDIAVIGKQNNWQLHFEIRQYGKPIDPLKYLPTPF